jgi:hypothetical protein
MLFGGLHLWQVLGVPVVLLSISRLFMRPWLAGRLNAFRPMLGLSLVGLACALGLAGSMWYRVLEVPDVGEPFDIREYSAGFPAPEKNEAALLIRQAVMEMDSDGKQLELKLPGPKRPSFPHEVFQEAAYRPGVTYSYWDLLNDVQQRGWPKDDSELIRWLDLMFKGDWFAKVQRAARLPLGVVEDPRQTDVVWIRYEISRWQDLAVLLAGRAQQFSATGEPRRALEQVETILGLSRQLGNHSTPGTFLIASNVEWTALTAYHRWLEGMGPQSELLRKGVAVLAYHHTRLPDPLDAIKGEYVVFRNWVQTRFGTAAIVSGKSRNAWRTEVWAVTWQVPWERERQNRITDAVYQTWLRHAQQPYWKRLAALEKDQTKRPLDESTVMARKLGLPPDAGPGSRLSASQWGELIQHSWVARLSYDRPPYDLVRLRGELLVTALV